MVYYIESNWIGIIKYIYCYVNNAMTMFSDNIFYGYQSSIFGYIESNSEEMAIKKFRELLLKKIGRINQ